jgi:hypothetical protein
VGLPAIVKKIIESAYSPVATAYSPTIFGAHSAQENKQYRRRNKQPHNKYYQHKNIAMAR